MLEIKLCCPVCSVHWQVYTLHYVACVMARSHAHCLLGMHVTGTDTIVLVSCQDPCTLSWEKMILAMSCMWAGYKTTISELVSWSDHAFTTDHTSVRLITQAALVSRILAILLVESGNARLGSPHLLMLASSVRPTAVLGNQWLKWHAGRHCG